MAEPYPDLLAFESACRDGPLRHLYNIASSRTPAFLHNGLVFAIRAGNVETTKYLLGIGAPIICETAQNVLAAPEDLQVPLFELLLQHGWNPDIPDTKGEFFLLTITSKPPILRLLLAHGANPNVGKIGYSRYDFEGRETNGDCGVLETAASRGQVESVRLLLDAGANMNNGFPLHKAAGSTLNRVQILPDPDDRRDFEDNQVAIMALLVERGADVNLRRMIFMGGSRPGYPLLDALRAGSVKRTWWLLDHGADPEPPGYETATQYAQQSRNQELIMMIDESIRAKRALRGEELERRT